MTNPDRTNWTMPEIGNVVDCYDDRLVVVGTFYVQTGYMKYPWVFGVSEAGLDKYFSTISKAKICGALDFVEKQHDLFPHDSDAGRLFCLMNPCSDPISCVGKHDFGIPDVHKTALMNDIGGCALGKTVEAYGKIYAVDGHFLVHKNGQPIIMVAMMNCSSLCNDDLYMAIDLERIVPSKPLPSLPKRKRGRDVLNIKLLPSCSP